MISNQSSVMCSGTQVMRGLQNGAAVCVEQSAGGGGGGGGGGGSMQYRCQYTNGGGDSEICGWVWVPN